MTTVTTILVYFLALGIGEGSEFLQPLGIVVWMAIATLLTLFIIPAYIFVHDVATVECVVRQTAHNRFKKKQISRRITPKDKELKPTPASSTVTLKQVFWEWLTPLDTRFAKLVMS